MAEDQLFYVGQKALIEKDGKVLVLSIPLIGADLPGGKIQVGEFDFGKSLQREVLEETGLTISVGTPVSTGYFRFNPQALKKDKASEFVYIVAYTCSYLSGDIQLSDEHESYQWVSRTDYKSIDDKNGLITKILTEYFTQ
jgi:8-oxo-dGTP pyrophosphatase MutT (NUDIX family)